VIQPRPVRKRANTSKWWGSCWSTGGRMQTPSPRGYDLVLLPAGVVKHPWQAVWHWGDRNSRCPALSTVLGNG
jgi:hypothetical protein